MSSSSGLTQSIAAYVKDEISKLRQCLQHHSTQAIILNMNFTCNYRCLLSVNNNGEVSEELLGHYFVIRIQVHLMLGLPFFTTHSM